MGKDLVRDLVLVLGVPCEQDGLAAHVPEVGRHLGVLLHRHEAAADLEVDVSALSDHLGGSTADERSAP